MWDRICDILSETDTIYQIDYDKERGMYSVSIFEGNHFQDEIIFDEVEKYER